VEPRPTSRGFPQPICVRFGSRYFILALQPFGRQIVIEGQLPPSRYLTGFSGTFWAPKVCAHSVSLRYPLRFTDLRLFLSTRRTWTSSCAPTSVNRKYARPAPFSCFQPFPCSVIFEPQQVFGFWFFLRSLVFFSVGHASFEFFSQRTPPGFF